MADVYHEGNRELQERFDTRRLADRIGERILRDSFDDDDRAFIESRDMFFLATADEHGMPQCSYKGGEPGFVRVIDESGEDYLYPREFFAPIELPRSVRRAVMQAA